MTDVTNSQVSAKYILDNGDVSEGELEAFGEYWETNVKIDDATPIASSSDNRLIKAGTIGATNDSELHSSCTE